MNISESFANWLEDQGHGILGDTIRIGGAPEDAPSTLFWVLSGGGSSIIKNKTNEKLKNYIISLYYRNTDAEDVYNTLQEIEETINSNGCTQLDGFDMIEIEATLFPTDQDIDVEDRTVGLLQVTITTYL